MSDEENVRALKTRIDELEGRLRKLEQCVDQVVESDSDSTGRLVKAAVDAHDRLVAIEKNIFPHMHPDLDAIYHILGPVNSLDENSLDRRPSSGTGKDTKK